MESTGGWSEELATDLHAHGHVVSIVNPLAIKSFGQSELSRTKTDKADAALIARYCITMHRAPWEPPSPVQQRLKRLARRRVALDEMRAQESNRLGAPGSGDVRSSIEATLSFLDRQIDEIDSKIRSDALLATRYAPANGKGSTQRMHRTARDQGSVGAPRSRRVATALLLRGAQATLWTSVTRRFAFWCVA